MASAADPIFANAFKDPAKSEEIEQKLFWDNSFWGTTGGLLHKPPCGYKNQPKPQINKQTKNNSLVFLAMSISCM